MEAVLNLVLAISLGIHVLLIGACVWRIWRGENIIDRIIGAEVIGTLTLSILVLVAMVTERSIYIDVALGLAALGFIGTIAYARYASDEQVF